jgi:SIT family siderophore-iron:H+ symporter-like MFS transporter
MSGRIVNGYFYTFLLVARDESYLSASRLTSIPSFSATVVAIIGALLVRHFRRLKPALVLGFTVQTLAYGLMIRFRQSTNSRAEIIVVQILKGFGIGLISFPAQAVIQSACAHEHLAAVTATYLIVFYLTVSNHIITEFPANKQSGIGTAIGGAIWTNVVPGKIEEYFAPINATLGIQAYRDPVTFAKLEWPMGTPERAAIARAQDEAQRLIVIVGTCVCALGLISTIFFISNIKLPDTQSIEENEGQAEELADKKAGKTPVVNM